MGRHAASTPSNGVPPYRSSGLVERARFELRDARELGVAALFLAVLAFAVVVPVLWAWRTHGGAPGLIIVCAVLAPFVIAALWWGTAPYRVGGRGALVVYDDHVEVPGPARGNVLRLEKHAIKIDRAAVRMHTWTGWFSLGRGELLTFRQHDGTIVRSLSTLTSPRPEFADELMLAQLTDAQRDLLENLTSQVAAQIFGNGSKS